VGDTVAWLVGELVARVVPRGAVATVAPPTLPGVVSGAAVVGVSVVPVVVSAPSEVVAVVAVTVELVAGRLTGGADVVGTTEMRSVLPDLPPP
jgi:hypothetical protein